MSKKQAIISIIEALGGEAPSGNLSLTQLLEAVAEAIENRTDNPENLG